MTTELSDSFPAPQIESQIETDPSIEAVPSKTPLSIEVTPPDEQAEATQFSTFSLKVANPIVAPEIGESQELLITNIAESIQAPKAARSSAAKAAEINLRFWVAAVGLGFVLLVAVSDWRSKDGPPIPFPSTSKIPQVR